MNSNMLKVVMTGLLVTGLLLAAMPVVAHHAGIMFSRDEVDELSGTIKEVQWTNPHIWIQIDVEGSDGVVSEWSVEWGSPNSLGRQGIRPSTFPVGDTVFVRIRPMTNGSAAGAFVGAMFADGSTVGRWE